MTMAIILTMSMGNMPLIIMSLRYFYPPYIDAKSNGYRDFWWVPSNNSMEDSRIINSNKAACRTMLKDLTSRSD